MHSWWKGKLVVTIESNMEVPQNVKNRVTIWSSNYAPGCLSEKNKNANLKRYMHANIQVVLIYNSQNKETTPKRCITNTHTHTRTHAHKEFYSVNKKIIIKLCICDKIDGWTGGYFA